VHPFTKALLFTGGTAGLGVAIGLVFNTFSVEPDDGRFRPSHIQAWPKKPSMTIALPEQAGRLLFFRRSIHPYLAEYDRRIEIVRPDGTRIKRKIHANTGGRTFIKLFWYAGGTSEGPFLRTEDRYGQIVASLRDGWVQRLVKQGGRIAFSGYADRDGIEYPTRRVPAVVRDGPGEFIGAIDGRKGPPVFVKAVRRGGMIRSK